jgi:hypothetical protein
VNFPHRRVNRYFFIDSYHQSTLSPVSSFKTCSTFSNWLRLPLMFFQEIQNCFV